MHIRSTLAATTLALNITGCVAPLSNSTQVEFRGQLKDSTGNVLANAPFQMCLPATYGLARIDARTGNAGDYGHRDQWVWLTTDGDGRFAHRFLPVTHSVSYWILPPLGPFPKEPPKPVVGLRTALGDGAWFIVSIEGESCHAFRYRQDPPESTPVATGVGYAAVTWRSGHDKDMAGWTVTVGAVRP